MNFTGYGRNQLTSFSYKLPSNSYASFQLTHRVNGFRERRQLFSEKREFKEKNFRRCKKDLIRIFPKCGEFCHSDSAFGICLTQNYKETRNLSIGGRKSNNVNPVAELQENNEACTDFVKKFFGLCAAHITSCQDVKADKEKGGIHKALDIDCGQKRSKKRPTNGLKWTRNGQEWSRNGQKR